VRARDVWALVRPVRRVQPGRQVERGRLARCTDVSDLRAVALRKLPRAVFDYVDGGADEEVTIAANLAAYRRKTFYPRTLVDVSDVDVATEVLGAGLTAPIGLAPTGYTRMVHPDGEPAAARAARDCGIPYTLSTVATATIEEVAATGHPHLWFQLYVLRDRGLTRSLVDRAAASGVEVLELSVDTPVAGHRRRDVRNGFTIPPRITASTLADMAVHLSWWTGMVAAPPLSIANLAGIDDGGAPKDATVESITELFDPSVSWDDLSELRSLWGGRLLVKGPLGPDDAKRVIATGADGIHLSNHGGRQLDRTVCPVDLVPAVRRAIGTGPTIVVDSGIRSGSDVALALAGGADLCMVGRAYLYGLAAGGEAGVRHVVELLISELRRTMQLCGVTSVEELRRTGPAVTGGLEAATGQ